MKILSKIGILLILLIAVYCIMATLGPTESKLSRSIVIHAPPATVYKHLADYHLMLKWSPWADKDPNCKYEYYGQNGAIGAGYKWVGNDMVGEGSMTTTAIEPNHSMMSHLVFIKPMSSEADAGFKLIEATGGDTQVTWDFSSQNAWLFRPMLLVMNMEKMLAPDYEKGLNSLKSICEADTAQ
jgi:Polyketide cyclase / dehydrase and lipid transport